jgi:hypothetical protein
VLSKGLLGLALALSCAVLVPYPYCYYPEKREDAGRVHLYFRRNPFFASCDETVTQNLLVDIGTPGEVVIHLEGKPSKTLRYPQCLERR